MRSFRTIISSKGQITIPLELREQLGIKAGTSINWAEDRGRLVLTPMTDRRIREIKGCLKPAPGESSAFEGLFAERERERTRENLKYGLPAGMRDKNVEASKGNPAFKQKIAKAKQIMSRYRNTLRALSGEDKKL
jgi:AbrB family looped-hinge helix DNA binding protein